MFGAPSMGMAIHTKFNKDRVVQVNHYLTALFYIILSHPADVKMITNPDPEEIFSSSICSFASKRQMKCDFFYKRISEFCFI